MKTIALIGEWYSNNMGEPLLFKCHKNILQSISSEPLRLYFLDFFGRTFRTKVDVDYTINTSKEKNISLKKKIIRKLYFSLPIKVQERIAYSFQEKINFSKKKRSLTRYLEQNFENVNAVIIVGAGTLKYDVRLDFGPYYQLIIETCQKMRIPCIVSAVGVESFYKKGDHRCRRFSKVLSNDAVKCITTRDNYDELLLYIHNDKTDTYKIPDPGIWSAECFSITKDKASNTVGIGIIDYKRFIEFNKGITKEQYETAIFKLIEKFDRRGVNWEFFNNGSGEDARYASYLLNRINGKSLGVIRTPSTPEELVSIISSYSGVITSRLHSCIVAYSLDIPYVAICWNNKLKYFSEFIGVPERVIEADNLNAEVLDTCFLDALKRGYDSEMRNNYLNDLQEIMCRYLKYFC